LPKRTLIAYDLGDTGKDFALAPEIRWRALRNLAGPEASLELTVSQRSSEQASASKTFSKAFGGFVDAVRKGCADRMQERTISHAGEEAFKRTLLPLSGIISLLSAYASAKLEVFSIARRASFAFNLLPSPAPDGLKRLMEKSDFTPDGDSRYFRDFLLRSDEIVCCACINLSRASCSHQDGKRSSRRYHSGAVSGAQRAQRRDAG
jgi:hypothetical protein